MSLNSYNPHTRYRDRATQKMMNFFKFMAFLLICALFGFWLGKQYGAQHLITLKDNVASLEIERDKLQENVTELSAKAQTADKRYEQLQEEVNSIIPKGPMQDLVTLVRTQLEQGMDPQRLSSAIRSARPPSNCSNPETKRFVVKTPAYNGPTSFAAVAEGGVIISGAGKSARNVKGLPEAWYDPAKSVTLVFKHGDKMEQKSGVLPLRYSVVHKDREYRFTIEKGARSFAKVIFDSCAYP